MKYLLVLIVVGVGLWMLTARFRRHRDKNGSKNQSSDRPKERPTEGPTERAESTASDGKTSKRPQEVVACRHCGVHLPAQEAVYREKLPYCSEAHLEAGPR